MAVIDFNIFTIRELVAMNKVIKSVFVLFMLLIFVFSWNICYSEDKIWTCENSVFQMKKLKYCLPEGYYVINGADDEVLLADIYGNMLIFAYTNDVDIKSFQIDSFKYIVAAYGEKLISKVENIYSDVQFESVLEMQKDNITLVYANHQFKQGNAEMKSCAGMIYRGVNEGLYILASIGKKDIDPERILRNVFDSVSYISENNDNEVDEWICANCSAKCTGNFCSNCGFAKEASGTQIVTDKNYYHDEITGLTFNIPEGWQEENLYANWGFLKMKMVPIDTADSSDISFGYEDIWEEVPESSKQEWGINQRKDIDKIFMNPQMLAELSGLNEKDIKMEFHSGIQFGIYRTEQSVVEGLKMEFLVAATIFDGRGIMFQMYDPENRHQKEFIDVLDSIIVENN